MLSRGSCQSLFISNLNKNETSECFVKENGPLMNKRQEKCFEYNLFPSHNSSVKAKIISDLWLSSDSLRLWGTIDPLCVTMITPADTEGRTDGKTKSRLSLLDVSVVAAALQQHRLSSSSVRNQVCVAKETSAKLPAMTEQREPFCFIDCSSFMLVRDSHIREFDSNHKFWRGCKRKTHVPVVCLQNIFFFTHANKCASVYLWHMGFSHMYMSDCFLWGRREIEKKRWENVEYASSEWGLRAVLFILF